MAADPIPYRPAGSSKAASDPEATPLEALDLVVQVERPPVARPDQAVADPLADLLTIL